MTAILPPPLFTKRCNQVIHLCRHLVTEMGASLLLGAAGILEDPLVENSGVYIRGWIQRLKDNPRRVAVACGKAQKAADWIRGHREIEAESEPEVFSCFSGYPFEWNGN